jgi:hypothetical protein
MGTADFRLPRLTAAEAIVILFLVGVGARGAHPQFASGTRDGIATVSGLRLHDIDWVRWPISLLPHRIGRQRGCVRCPGEAVY